MWTFRTRNSYLLAEIENTFGQPIEDSFSINPDLDETQDTLQMSETLDKRVLLFKQSLENRINYLLTSDEIPIRDVKQTENFIIQESRTLIQELETNYEDRKLCDLKIYCHQKSKTILQIENTVRKLKNDQMKLQNFKNETSRAIEQLQKRMNSKFDALIEARAEDFELTQQKISQVKSQVFSLVKQTLSLRLEQKLDMDEIKKTLFRLESDQRQRFSCLENRIKLLEDRNFK